MAEPRPFRFRSSRLTLAGWEWGDAADPPLLLVHGARDLARSWDAVAGAFAGSYCVIAPDLRGHGGSEWANDGAYSLVDFVADLAALVEQRGFDRFDLVGHSLGGNVAWRYAALFPERVRRLVVIEGLGASAELQPAIDARPLADRMREEVDSRSRERRARIYPDLGAVTARMQSANPRLTDALAQRLAAAGTRAVPGGLAFRHDPGLGAMKGVDLTMAERRTLWGTITAPVLLVYGRASWATDPEADGRASAFRNARTVMLDDAGHWVHHDRTGAFIGAVSTFLQEAGGQASASG